MGDAEERNRFGLAGRLQDFGFSSLQGFKSHAGNAP